MFTSKKSKLKTLNAGESDLFNVGQGQGLSFIATGTGSVYKLDAVTRQPILISTYVAGASQQYGPYQSTVVLQIVNATGSVQVNIGGASEGLLLQAKISQAGLRPNVGDKIYPVVPIGWEASDGNLFINRGAGYVLLNSGLGPYTLQSGDIPPQGGDWPIIVRGTPGNMVSLPLDINYPATVPSQPAAPNLSVAGSGALSASYSAPSTGGSPITSYDLQVFDGNGNLLTTIFSASNPSLLDANSAGIAVGNSYKVKVRANNAIGSSPYSDFSATVTAVTATSTNRAVGSNAVGAFAM